jgi:hypothetical protein
MDHAEAGGRRRSTKLHAFRHWRERQRLRREQARSLRRRVKAARSKALDDVTRHGAPPGTSA